MCRILILDDEQYYAETIELLLKQEDETHPEIVTGAEQAVEKVTRAVRNNKPYDILLIDYRLGPDQDGIEVFKKLRAISPDSDGIILTGFDDTESGLRAYKAGAFRYLPKTTRNPEMLFVIRALRQWREEQRENNWQRVFRNVLEASIREKDFESVARAVVNHSLKLGFTRAHLVWNPAEQSTQRPEEMIGIACAGEELIASFENRKFPLSGWNGSDTLHTSQNAIFLRDESLKHARPVLEAFGYQPPAGEIILLPLQSSNRLLGILLLDHGSTNRTLSHHERDLLNFFSRQVSLALEHAALYTREQRTAIEQTILSRLGREITSGATDKSPEKILDDARESLRESIDTTNFMAILIDEDANELDVRLRYRNNQRCAPAWQPIGAGLEGWFLASGEPLRIASDVEGFARQNGITLSGEVPSSWLGVPLRVNGKLFGGIILQQFQETRPFSKYHERFLSGAADQISGAIENCRATEKERREVEKLNVLSRAGKEMLQIAQENEPNLWSLVLTIATARFGVGFNNAMLFLKSGENTLLGRFAIGTENAEQAQQDWQEDELRNYTFDDFLCDLRENRLKLTDFDALVKEIEIPLQGRADAFTEVIHTGSAVMIEAGEVKQRLPVEITSRINISSACAVLPLPVKGDVPGVLLVDKKHNSRKIASQDLIQLQTVLNHAGLILDTLREYEKSQNLLDTTQAIMNDAGNKMLKEVLNRICKAALSLTGAKWSAIYPFVDQEDELAFDLANMSYAGTLRSSIEKVQSKNRPERNGMTASILKHGELIVPNVKETIHGIRISKYKFIKEEGVKAFFGIRIQDATTNKPLGVFYLNFISPRHFSKHEIDRAKSFASLAAFVISNARRLDEQKMRKGLEAALKTAQAVSSNTEKLEMLKNVLEEMHNFFKETTLCVLTYEESENSLKFAPGTLDFYTITNPKFRRMHNFPLEGGSLACSIAFKAQKSGKMELENVPDVHARGDYFGLVEATRSEVCVSLMSVKGDLLGVLVLEREKEAGFDQDDEALVKMVALQLSLGLEGFEQLEQVTFNKTVSALTASAADLAHEVNSEVGNIAAWAYLIKEFAEESLTISNYASQIEESARRLATAGAWKEQGKLLILLDESLRKYGEPIARQLNIEFKMLSGAEQVYVKANPSQFQRVLRHLIRNAGQAMKELRTKRIIIQTKIIGEDEVEVLIQDFGPGVSEKIRQALFKTNITTQKTNGGYGLLLSRQLVEEMGGSIRLLPKVAGKGAVFSIKLPVSKEGKDQ